MGEGGDLLEPPGGLHRVPGVELTELPGVGDPADAVTQDEQTHDGQADLGLANLNSISQKFIERVDLFSNVLPRCHCS